ncbi:MAG: helix-turn-helix transcriptional regulator [Bacteroidales bacterium]|nr:helix-turn-helix transcriptional regulator [Bacteroidales bacterium]
MKDRIRQIMEYEGLNAAQFSKKVQINGSALSHILNDRNLPSSSALMRIISSCPEIDVEWLMTGKGEMLKSQTGADYPVLFPENPISVPEVGAEEEYGREKGSKRPSKQMKSSDIQEEIPVKPTHSRITKIVVFYADNTFEEFCR